MWSSRRLHCGQHWHSGGIMTLWYHGTLVLWNSCATELRNTDTLVTILSIGAIWLIPLYISLWSACCILLAIMQLGNCNATFELNICIVEQFVHRSRTIKSLNPSANHRHSMWSSQSESVWLLVTDCVVNCNLLNRSDHKAWSRVKCRLHTTLEQHYLH